MVSRRIRLPGSLTARRPPVDHGYYHFCAEVCVHIEPIERVICEHLAHGLSNKEIGTAMGLSHNTVKNRLTVLMKKLEVHDRVQLVVAVIASGLVDLPK